MQVFNGQLMVCIPIVVGALIAIIPTSIEKTIERKHKIKEKQEQNKQDIYVDLISLFAKVINGKNSESELDQLRDKINLISITGSVDVVKALKEYLDTWGKADSQEQNRKYSSLLKAIRVDLEVDKKEDVDFPEIGIIDINTKRR